MILDTVCSVLILVLPAHGCLACAQVSTGSITCPLLLGTTQAQHTGGASHHWGSKKRSDLLTIMSHDKKLGCSRIGECAVPYLRNAFCCLSVLIALIAAVLQTRLLLLPAGRLLDHTSRKPIHLHNLLIVFFVIQDT